MPDEPISPLLASASAQAMMRLDEARLMGSLVHETYNWAAWIITGVVIAGGLFHLWKSKRFQVEVQDALAALNGKKPFLEHVRKYPTLATLCLVAALGGWIGLQKHTVGPEFFYVETSEGPNGQPVQYGLCAVTIHRPGYLQFQSILGSNLGPVRDYYGQYLLEAQR